MFNDQLSFLCANYSSENLLTDNLTCFEGYYSNYKEKALQKKKEIIVNKRLHVLNIILQKISDGNFIGKEEFTEYIRYKYRKNLKISTLKSTFSAISKFLLFYPREEIAGLTRHDIEAFIEHEQDRGLKPSTVKTSTCNLYAFVKFLAENDIVSYELMQRKIKVKLPQRLPRAIDPEDINSLLSLVDDTKELAMILLLLRTGMRIGELLNIRVEDLDLYNSRVIIYEAEKTGVGRVVYFSEDAADALTAWLDERSNDKDLLFYSRGHNSMAYETARRMFIRYLHKANLQHKNITLHCLRHTYATDLLNAGMRLECLQVLMGHASIEVTRIYAKLTDRSREEEYFRAMHLIENGGNNGLYEFDN